IMRELRETRYQFDRPWVVDSTHTEQTLGLSATPLAEAAAATVAWWRAQTRG
ncbi:MAG: NAD-dependent epimerase/dehydratase, partial [Acidimicrobiaceae bacterium]